MIAYVLKSDVIKSTIRIDTMLVTIQQGMYFNMIQIGGGETGADKLSESIFDLILISAQLLAIICI